MVCDCNSEEFVVECVEGEVVFNVVWFKLVMIGFMFFGLVWIFVFYILGMQFLILGFDNWNLVIGFGIVLIGFLMIICWC